MNAPVTTTLDRLGRGVLLLVVAAAPLGCLWWAVQVFHGATWRLFP